MNKADVVIPDAAPPLLAVLTSAISVQEDPFHCSTNVTLFAGGPSPDTARAAVAIPAPPKPNLALFKSFTSVQLDPSQFSVLD